MISYVGLPNIPILTTYIMWTSLFSDFIIVSVTDYSWLTYILHKIIHTIGTLFLDTNVCEKIWCSPYLLLYFTKYIST